MPTLNIFFVLFTDGTAPRPPGHPDFTVRQLASVPVPDEDAQFFGPFAAGFPEQARKAKAAFLLHGQRIVRGGVGEFFSHAHTQLALCVQGREGFALDLLKAWPMPFSEARELPPDPLPEDLFAVAFHEVEPNRYLARTHGLSKLDQAEIAFQFRGADLTDDAALMCAHLSDYVMTQSRRVVAGQTMTFGFDKLLFTPSQSSDSFAPLIEALLPAQQRPRLELLDVEAVAPMTDGRLAELSEPLRRSFLQRMILEEHEVPGESPNQSLDVKICACLETEDGRRAWRDEPSSAKESGWTFTCRKRHGTPELKVVKMGELVSRVPQVSPYLALPPGSSVEWSGKEVFVHCGDEREPDEDDPDTDSFRVG